MRKPEKNDMTVSGNQVTDRRKTLCDAGYRSFFFSGVCAIASGVIVSLLQSHWGFAYGITGTLVAFLNIGNVLASFACGFLPRKIGVRNTVAILCAGYFCGYMIMACTGVIPLLMAAFFFVGLSKGSSSNNCNVLVGENAKDRVRGLTLMNAFFACGALLGPILISLLGHFGSTAPVIGIAVFGALLWLNFMNAGLPGKPVVSGTEKEKEFSFLHDRTFWLITALIFCQNAAENSVNGWLVTYYRDQNILSGVYSTYTVTVMWGATLIARLLIAYFFHPKDTFQSLAVMGLSCMVLYGLMIFADAPAAALLMLFGFSFAIAGVYPLGVAGIGQLLSNASMGILIPVSSIGGILAPWIIGIVADAAGLRVAMLLNLIPCLGIAVFSILVRRARSSENVPAAGRS